MVETNTAMEMSAATAKNRAATLDVMLFGVRLPDMARNKKAASDSKQVSHIHEAIQPLLPVNNEMIRKGISPSCA
jgi:hypothetical protein